MKPAGRVQKAFTRFDRTFAEQDFIILQDHRSRDDFWVLIVNKVAPLANTTFFVIARWNFQSEIGARFNCHFFVSLSLYGRIQLICTRYFCF